MRKRYFLIQYPFLIGLIPVFRTLVTGKRLLLSNWTLFGLYMIYYPLIFLGLIFYTWGFILGPYRSGLTSEIKSI